MRKVQSKIPRWQTLVADTRASIATWTGAVDVRRVAPERKEEEFPLGTSAYAQAIGVPRAVRKPRRPRSKRGFEGKGYAASSVVINQSKFEPNCEVCHGSRGSLAALWAVAVECPCASARAVPAARPLSARTPRDARTTRGWLRGLLLGRVRRKRRWRASRSSRCWASASAWCSKRRTEIGALLRLAAGRCSLE